jgi:hypothetical protein
MRDVLTDSDLRLQFAGHETFPLRLLWLKKAFDAVAYHGADRRTFQEQAAIARFGVGKNMALAMRHWALATGTLVDEDGVLIPTALARLLFDDRTGLDPFLEDPSTLWLAHAALAGAPEQSTTFFFVFNTLNQTVFDREGLVEAIHDLAKTRGARATAETVKRDVEVFLRSYAPRSGDAGEDAAEPLLAELGLIRESRLSGQFEFVRGPKPNLQDGVFALVLKRFWARWHSEAPTLSAEQASYGAGSPGRVFKLDEDSVMARLARIGEITDGAIIWTDTAGLRQVSLTRKLTTIDDTALITASYPYRRAT